MCVYYNYLVGHSSQQQGQRKRVIVYLQMMRIFFCNPITWYLHHGMCTISLKLLTKRPLHVVLCICVLVFLRPFLFYGLLETDSDSILHPFYFISFVHFNGYSDHTNMTGAQW